MLFLVTVVLLGIILTIGDIIRFKHLIGLIILLFLTIILKFYLALSGSNNNELFGFYLSKIIIYNFYLVCSSITIFFINKFKKIIIEE